MKKLVPKELNNRTSNENRRNKKINKYKIKRNVYSYKKKEPSINTKGNRYSLYMNNHVLLFRVLSLYFFLLA